MGILIEPVEGSVVMVNGPTGTAYQRFFSDGLWHGANGKVITWYNVLRVSSHPVALIYTAPDEEE